MSLFAELKRRNVIRMAGLYLVGAWLLVQVAGTVLPWFKVSEAILRGLVAVLMIGFGPALVFAWVFELTPDGIKRDAEVPLEQSIAPQTAQRMNRMIIAMLVLALVYFGLDKFVLAPNREAAKIASLRKADLAQAPVVVAVPVPAASSKSIAVLPFENLSEDKANGYFADGIQDQILTGLAKIGDLKVISRTSTQKYASRPDNLLKIARELGVAHILEGSVQRSGNKVRINVQLIDAATDNHLWADTYDRTLDDVFAVESEVAQKIAESLAANLSSGEREALAEKPTEVPAAYDAYLKARALNSLVLQTSEQGEQTLAAYREAVRLDPKFALAWAQLARELFRMTWFGWDPTGALQSEGVKALERASQLTPGSAQAELARGVYMYYIERDFAGALAVMNSLKPKLPNDADVRMWAGYLNRRTGLFKEAVADMERARELSPNDANISYQIGNSLIVAGDCDRGIREIDASLALAPDNTNALEMKLQCAWLHGDFAQAAAYLAAADASAPFVQGMQGVQLLFQHDYAAASKQLQRAIAGGGGASTSGMSLGYLPARVDWQINLALSQQRAGAAAQAQASYRQLKAEATAALAAKQGTRYVETYWRATLGMALAGLGERDAAAAQARLAISLVPESVDHMDGPTVAAYAARIFALNGDAANAVPLLRHALQVPASATSIENLRFEPYWDNIRDDPGFQALLATPARTPGSAQ
jgi:TolB-like protein/Flp pilus assembly protein TadD